MRRPNWFVSFIIGAATGSALTATLILSIYWNAMTHPRKPGCIFCEDFEERLDRMIAAGEATPAAKADALAQQRFYDDNKSWIDKQYAGKAIAISNERIFAADMLYQAEEQARAAYPDRLFLAVQVPDTKDDH